MNKTIIDTELTQLDNQSDITQLDNETISKLTGLPIEEIEKMKKQLKDN